ncbi:MFS transporter [Streptomyces sp. NPDC059900]|uniref:MFS transporter n=1 Tax=Streptomyces sp. NPDC059900 TaxID=3155816 RepID=UPI003418745F
MAAESGATWTRRQRALLWLLCSAQFVLIVDVVVVNIAVPSIRSELDVPVSFLQLTSVAYTVAFGSLMIVAGRAGDIFGRRRLLIAGLILFTVMSLLCGLAQEGWQLFAARAGQGVGAAMVSPSAMALLVGAFREGQLRNRALGIWTAVASAGGIAGQLLGGVVTEYIGWRGIFLINVPIGALVVISALRLLSADGQRPSDEPRERLDVPGAILLAATLGGTSVLLADVSGGESWLTATGLLVVGLLAVALVMVERRAPEPVLPGKLLARRNVAVANVVLMLNASATTSALYFSTLTMQTEMGYGPLQTGLGFAPITLIVLLIAPKAGALVERVGARTFLLLGSLVAAAGLLLLVFTASGSGSYLTGILPGLALVAAGNGLSYAPMVSLATAVPESEHGRASGLINTAQELGSAIGLAVLASVATLGALGSLGNYSLGYLAAAGAALVAGMLAFAAPEPTPPPQTPQDPPTPLAAREGNRTEET